MADRDVRLRAAGAVRRCSPWPEPGYLSERFPAEVRAAASAFCYHERAIVGGLVAATLTYFAINYYLGFGIPLLVGTVVGAVSFVFALLLGPETKGTPGAPSSFGC